jgi:WD40 repeat protein
VRSFLAGNGRIQAIAYTPDGASLVVDLRRPPTQHPWMGFDFRPAHDLLWIDRTTGESRRRFRLCDTLYGPGGTLGDSDQEDRQPDGPTLDVSALDVSFTFAPFRVACAWEWTNKEDGVCVYDVEAAATLYLSTPYKTHVMRLALAPDGNALAVATVNNMDGTSLLEVWQLGKKAEPEATETPSADWRTLRYEAHDEEPGLAIYPEALVFDGQLVAVAGPGRPIVQVRPANSREATEVEVGFEPRALALMGGRLAVAGDGLGVLEAGRWSPWRRTGPTVTSVALDRTSNRVALGCADGTVEVLDGAGRRLLALGGSGEALTATAFAPDGLTLAVGSESGRVTLWDLAD